MEVRDGREEGLPHDTEVVKKKEGWPALADARFSFSLSLFVFLRPPPSAVCYQAILWTSTRSHAVQQRCKKQKNLG